MRIKLLVKNIKLFLSVCPLYQHNLQSGMCSCLISALGQNRTGQLKFNKQMQHMLCSPVGMRMLYPTMWTCGAEQVCVRPEAFHLHRLESPPSLWPFSLSQWALAAHTHTARCVFVAILNRIPGEMVHQGVSGHMGEEKNRFWSKCFFLEESLCILYWVFVYFNQILPGRRH